MSQSEPDRERLTLTMTALDDGLNRIARKHEGAVQFFYEDPETFGAGHFVFYPENDTRSRFAIEEQYTGTDWSDDERLPTLSAATRNCPETATKLPAGGHENCPLTVMGFARHEVVCLAALRG